jgi:hypothetical protein
MIWRKKNANTVNILQLEPMPRLRFACPHCRRPLPAKFLRSAAGKIYNRLRTPTGPPKVLRPCPFCRKKLGAREMRLHMPRCPKRSSRRSRSILPIRTVVTPRLSRSPVPGPLAQLLARAEDISREAHAGQTEEGTGDAYIKHVERVVELVEGENAKMVAWLHDVIEDSATTAADLIARGMPLEIVHSVELLTRSASQTYAAYIQKIKDSGDALAIAVKLADLKDHFRPNCPARLRPQYEKAWKTFTGVSYQ